MARCFPGQTFLPGEVLLVLLLSCFEKDLGFNTLRDTIY